ncbi:hypothetical protein D3C72_1654050 [compost metagenome]
MLEVALLEQLFKPWNGAGRYPARATFACIVSHQVRRFVLDHLAASAGGALEARVVNDHQFVVSRQVQVQFAAAHAVLETLLEAGQGVFGGFALGATVAVNLGHVCSFKKK